MSKPRVKQVQHDQAGQVESVVIQKGILFRKEVEVPSERIAQVTSASEDEAAATVVIQMSQQETEELTSQGAETLAAPTDVLGQVGLPTFSPPDFPSK